MNLYSWIDFKHSNSLKLCIVICCPADKNNNDLNRLEMHVSYLIWMLLNHCKCYHLRIYIPWTEFESMTTILSDKDLPKVYCYDTVAILKAIQSREQFTLIDYDDSIIAVVGLSAGQHLPEVDLVPELAKIETKYSHLKDYDARDQTT